MRNAFYKMPSDREEQLRCLARLRPIDDIFMYQMFKDNIPLTELLLHRIIGIRLTVQSVNVQYNIELHAVGARSLRLDVFATDKDGNAYDIEVQREDSGAIPKRARYHIGAMDVDHLKQGEQFSELRDAYVIFITENDYWKDGEAVHVFDRMDIKTGKPLGDGTHIIYVNGQYHADDLIGDLMHDFMCSDPSDMRIPQMLERADYLKNNQGGVSKMCQIMEEYAKKYAKEYAKEYAKNVTIDIALNMLKSNKLSLAEIAKITSLPEEKIASLASLSS